MTSSYHTFLTEKAVLSIPNADHPVVKYRARQTLHSLCVFAVTYFILSTCAGVYKCFHDLVDALDCSVLDFVLPELPAGDGA